MPEDQAILKLIDEVRQMSACTMDFDAKLSRLEEWTSSHDIGRLIFDPPDGKNMSAQEILSRIRGSK